MHEYDAAAVVVLLIFTRFSHGSLPLSMAYQWPGIPLPSLPSVCFKESIQAMGGAGQSG